MNGFIQKFKHFLRRPTLNDPESTRDAQMLWIMILSLNVIGILVVTSSAAVRPINEVLTTAGFTVTVFLLSTYLLSLLHKGQLTKAGHIFSSFFSILFFVNAILFNGIRDVNISIYFLLVLMAGLVLGKRGLAIYGTVAVISTTILFFAEKADLFEAIFLQYPKTEDVIILNFVIICACLLIYAALNNTDQGYSLLIKALEQLKTTTVSKEYADNLIASMGDMLFVIDQDLRIKTVNQSTLHSLNYSEKALIGRPFQALFSNKNLPLWLSPDQARISESAIIKQSDYKITCCDGRELEISMSASMLELLPGEFGVICVARDISKQKATERALTEAKTKAVEFANAKSNFMTNMSHEIRTPLNAVIGLSTILTDTELDEEQKEYTDQILESSEELMAIVQNLLDFSDGEYIEIELEPSQVNLFQALYKTVSVYEEQAGKKGLSFSANIDDKLPQLVWVDADRLDRALANVLDNAIKFTNEGSINVNIFGRDTAEGHLDLGFEVSDTGIGIPEEYFEKIFESFQQVDSSLTRDYEGTGIGLALTKMIVYEMGGNVSVESELGKGSTFKFNVLIEKVEQGLEDLPII